MRKFVGSSLAVGAATAGAIALTAPSAFAVDPWTVTGGTSITGTTTSVTFKDVTSNQTFKCTSSRVPGTVKNGSNLPGAGIGTLAGSAGTGTFTGCTGPLGSTGSATLTAGTLNAVNYAAPVTTGTITAVSATLTIHDILGTCNATVGGAANTVSYNNTTHVLTITPDTTPALTILTASGSGCAGLIAAGHKATLSAAYTLSPAITITHP